MGRNKGLTRGYAFPILLAGMVGYLAGGWHPTAPQSQGLSAAQSVALRFPQQWDRAAPVASDTDLSPAAGVLNTSPVTAANGTDDGQFALLNPTPMVPQPVHSASQAAVQAPARQASVQLAFATDSMPPAAVTTEPMPKMPAVLAAPLRVNRAPVAPHRAVMNRPGFMLDDAQIASIKGRLHLTPDQEQMWPAVEAALRNIAYTRAQQARRRGVSGETTQVADIDPDSVAGLKSAAVPLIMSFDEDQKQEVRNLAHVMGLDQLASQF
jgi:hypothetical protein